MAIRCYRARVRARVVAPRHHGSTQLGLRENREDDTLYAVGSSSTTTALGTTSGALAVPIDTIGALGILRVGNEALDRAELTVVANTCACGMRRSNGRA